MSEEVKSPEAVQTEKINQLWKLLEELGAMGVQIGISGGLKNGYSMRIKLPTETPSREKGVEE